jgi:hypothetical protein
MHLQVCSIHLMVLACGAFPNGVDREREDTAPPHSSIHFAIIGLAHGQS